MEIYNIAKYENIADRIRRLASANKTVTQPAEITSPRNVPKTQPNFYGRNPISPADFTSRMRFGQKQSQSRIATQQTEQKSDQQSLSLINELMTMRQNRPTRTISRQKILKNTKILEEQVPKANYKMEQRNVFSKYGESQKTEDEGKATLSKNKSQNSLKIDEILNNYNNYKQNRQQFMQSINKSPKTEPHQRMISQNLKDYSENVDRSRNQPRKTITKEAAFEQIDNIWNQKVLEEDPAPKFMRSIQEKKDRFAQLTQILNSQLQQKPKVEPKSQIYGKGKLLLRRLEQKKENDNTEQILKRNLVMSPRGLRVPGKICKNNDKSFGVLPKYK